MEAEQQQLKILSETLSRQLVEAQGVSEAFKKQLKVLNLGENISVGIIKFAGRKHKCWNYKI
jgi:hypothetical protein